MQSRYFIGLAALLLALPAWAADVGLVGVFPGKAAVLVIDGGAPTAVRIGRTKHGVTVLSADESQAMIEIEGKRRTLRLGQYASSTSRDTRQKGTIAADLLGHLYADGEANGGSVSVLVENGASTSGISASAGATLGIASPR